MENKNPKLTPTQFAQRVKSKYPQYQNINDDELVNKMIEKYPSYRDQIDFSIKKKEVSKSTSTNQRSASAVKSSSSVSSSQSISSELQERIMMKDAEKYMEENKHKPYTSVEMPKPRGKKAMSITDLQQANTTGLLGKKHSIYQEYKSATEISEEEAMRIKQDLDDELSNTGFWNKATNAAKTWWNNVFDDPALQADTNPLAKHVREIEKSSNSQNITDEEKMKAAYDLELKTRMQSLNNSKQRSFISKVQKDGRIEHLKKATGQEYDKVNQQFNEVNSKKQILEIGLEEKASELEQFISELEKINPKELKSQSEVDSYNEKVRQLQSLQNDYINTFQEYESTQGELSKIGAEVESFETNLDMMKRDQRILKNNWHRISDSVLRAGSSYMALVETFTDNPGLKRELQTKRQDFNIFKEERDRKFSNPIQVDDINNASDFGRYLFTELASGQLYNLFSASTGAGGIASIGVVGAGDKRKSMVEEMEKGEAYYSTFQQITAPIISGTAETVGAMVDRAMLRGAANTYKAASTSQRKLIAENFYKEFAKNTYKGTRNEVLEESGVQIVNNALDHYLLGKKDVHILDGVKDAAAGALFLTGAIQTGSGMAGMAIQGVKAFSYDNKITKISDKIVRYEAELANLEEGSDAHQILTEQISKLQEEAKSVLSNKVKTIGSLSNEDFNEILRLEKELSRQSDKAKIIQDSSLSKDAKDQALKDLHEEFKQTDEKRIEILKKAEENGTDSQNTNQIQSVDDQDVVIETETTEDSNQNTENQTEYNSDEDLEFLESLEIEERQEIEEELDNSPRLSEVIDSPQQFTYNGEVGHITTDGQQVVFETNNTIHELGNINDVSDAKLIEFGIEPSQELDIEVSEDYSVTIDGKTFTNPNENPNDAITIGKNGEYSINLVNDKGQSRTIRGQRAEQIAYNYKLKELENGSEQQIRSAETNTGLETETRQATVSQENGDTQQRPKKRRRRKQRSLKQHKAPLTKAEREEAELNRLIEEEERLKEQALDLSPEGKLQPNEISIPESKPQEVTYNGSTYYVTEKRNGEKEVKSSKGKVIEPIIKRRNGDKFTDMVNPNYAKIVSIYEGINTSNQESATRKKVLANAIDFLNETNDIWNIVLAQFANGAKVIRASYNSEVANREAKGIHWTNNGTKERELPSINGLAHEIWENHFGIDSVVTDMDIRDTIIDFLLTYGSRVDVENDAIDLYLESNLDAANDIDQNSSFYKEAVERRNQKELDAFLSTASEEAIAIYNERVSRIEAEEELEKNLSLLTDEELQQYYYDNIQTNLYAAPRAVQQQFYAEEEQRTTEQNRQVISGSETTVSQVNSNGPTNQTRLGNERAVGSSSERKMVGEPSKTSGDNGKTETSNSRGSESTIKKSEKITSDSSIDYATDEELQALELERSIFDKLLDTLEKWERGIDKFGKENLSMGLPLVLAKGAIKVMRATALTTKKADEIVRAGLDYIKESDWYKNLTDADKNKITLQNFKQLVAESIREINRSEKKVEKAVDYINNLKQKLKDGKLSAKETQRNLIDFLRTNKINGQITETEINRLIAYASKIISATNKDKAFNEFIDMYQKIQDKAKLREEKKNRPKREVVEARIEKYLNEGKSEAEIVDEFSRESEKMIVRDYFNRQKSNTNPNDVKDKFDRMVEESNESQKESKSITEHLNDLAKGFWEKAFDRQFYSKMKLNKAGLRLVRNYLIASKGSPGYAKAIMEKAYNTIYKGLSDKEIEILDKLIAARRIVAIDKNRAERNLPAIVHSFLLNGKEAKIYLDSLRAEIGNELFDSLDNKASAYFKVFQDQLNEMHEAGLISKETLDTFFNVDYQPTKFIDFMKKLDEDSNYLERGTNAKNPIQKMTTGWDGAKITNSMWLLSNSISTISRSIATNRTNKALIREIEKRRLHIDDLKSKPNLSNKEKSEIKYFDELDKLVLQNEVVKIKNGKPVYKYQKTPLGYTKVVYFDNGKEHTFFMENEMHKSYADGLKGIWSDGVKQKVAIASGNNLVKTLATGNNPTFFLTNSPRDFIWIATVSEEYGNNVILNMAKLLKDTALGIRDIANNTEMFQNAVRYGLMMDFLMDEGRIEKESLSTKVFGDLFKLQNKTRDKATSILDFISIKDLQMYSEIGFRMAVFNRSIKNQLKELGLKDISEITDKQQLEDLYTNAVVSARMTMDFNKGGSITKDLDALVPYLNAASQGTRMLAESLYQRPMQTTFRIAQTTAILGGIPIALSLYLLSRGDDDESALEKYFEAMEGVSKFDKVNYMIIPSKKNEDGEYTYIRIAKPQQLSPFITLAEGSIKKTLGKIGGVNFKDDTVELMTFGLNNNISPIEFKVNPLNMIADNVAKVPFAKAALSYKTGYDFFREQDISHSKGKVPVEAEGFESKSVEDFYKTLGKNFGFSPARMKVAMESVFTTTGTTPYVALGYTGMDLMFSNKSGEEQMELMFKNLRKSAFGRVIKETNEFNRKAIHNKSLSETINKVNVEKHIIASEVKSKINDYVEGKISKDEASEYIRSTYKGKPNDIKRNLKRLAESKRNKEISANTWEIKYASTNEERVEYLLHYFGSNLFNTERLNDKQKKMRKELLVTKSLTKETRRLYLQEIKKPSN